MKSLEFPVVICKFKESVSIDLVSECSLGKLLEWKVTLICYVNRRRWYFSVIFNIVVGFLHHLYPFPFSWWIDFNFQLFRFPMRLRFFLIWHVYSIFVFFVFFALGSWFVFNLICYKLIMISLSLVTQKTLLFCGYI